MGLDRLRRGRGWPVAATAGAGALGALLTAAWAWLSWPSDLGQVTAGKLVFEALGSTKETFLAPAVYHSLKAVREAGAFAAAELLARGRVLLVAAILLWLLGRSRRWLYALAALAALEVLLFAQHSRVVTRLEAPYPRAWAEAAKAQTGDFRVLHVGMPARNPVMYAGLQDVWGYGPLLMTRYFTITDHFWRMTTWGSKLEPREMMRRNPLLALLRARLIFLNNESKEILAAPPQPRLRLVENWEAMQDPEKIFKRLMEPGFDPARTILLETAPEPLPEKGGAAGSVSLAASDTDWLEIDADLPRAAILFVGDVYSEHWRAWPLVPGPQERYDVLPAYHALRAIPLAAGRHRLRLEYRPSGYVVGRWISLAAWLVFLALCAVRAGWRPPLPRRRPSAAAALVLSLAFVEAIGYAAASRLGLWSSPATRDPDLGWMLPYPGIPPEKPDIVFLGDSVTAGGELPDERWRETFAGLLGGWNAGVDGYGTYQERDRYVRDLARLGARKVVLVVCFNDLMSEAESREMIRTTLRDNFDVGEKTILDYEPWYRIARWLRARAAKSAWTDRDPDEAAFAASPETWREWTGAIAGLKKAAAPARLHVVLAPLRPHVRRRREGLSDSPVNARLARFCAKEGIPFLDLLPAFARAGDPEHRIFGDPFHFTVVGHRIAADAMRPFLRTDG
ncbi:MAG: SGNH/GDSL hydrolase family protein [Elusimicrobiota bacterium]|nr:MAG: SGNH/GDSL hydrolase family protein [Elusimicrobiota bacterium]